MVNNNNAHKQLVDEIERLKEHYRRLVESISEGVSVMTPEGVIISVSPIIEQMMGWSAAELVGSQSQSFIHPADLPKAIDCLQRLANGERVPPIQIRILQKSGEYRPVEVLSQSEVEDEHTRSVWSLTRDLTKDVQLRDQTEKLHQERQRVISLVDLIRAASFRASSPLSAIHLAAYSLAKQSTDPATLTSIERIERNIQHFARLIERVLTMAELDADRTHFSFAPVNLNQLVNYVQTSITSPAVAPAITLTTELTPTLPPVRADELQLYRAIQEVVTNAIQYTPESGEVMIKTFQRDGYGVLEVQDAGVGIPPELMPYIFERFHHFSLPGSGLEKLGLGLSIAKKIIDKHGGSIDVTSIPGKSSTVTIAIPLYRL